MVKFVQMSTFKYILTFSRLRGGVIEPSLRLLAQKYNCDKMICRFEKEIMELEILNTGRCICIACQRLSWIVAYLMTFPTW